eukprot:735428_1
MEDEDIEFPTVCFGEAPCYRLYLDTVWMITTTATIRIHTQIQMHRQPECGHTTSNSNPTNDRQKSPNPQTQTTITAQQVNVEPWTIHSGDNPKTGMTGTKSSHASAAKIGVTGQKSPLASVAKIGTTRQKSSH